MVDLPQLRYPITQSYPWPFFTPMTVAGALVSLLVLVPLNSEFLPSSHSTVHDTDSLVALTGYQVIPAPSPNYNATDPHWWNRFGVHNRPGTLCASYSFSAGDTLSTTYGIFPWTVVSPNVHILSDSKFLYTGVNFDSCDVYSMGIQADVLATTVDVYATVMCNSADIPILIRTAWTGWGSSSSYDQKVQRLINARPEGNLTGPASGINSVNEM